MLDSNKQSFSQRTARFRLALFWAVLGALGVLAVFPYQLELLSAAQLSQLQQAPFPLPVLAFLSALQTGILLLGLSWLGLWLGEKLGLTSAFANALVNRLNMPAVSKPFAIASVCTGLLGGLLILGLDRLFRPFMPLARQATEINIALWKRALASFYGGITEELLIRLFLMTLLVWLASKLNRRTPQAAWPFWVGIVAAALLFGAGHLPATAALWPLTTVVIIRALLLNGILGLAFGYLYWRAGLEYAMVAHFIADIVLHVVGGR